MKCDEAKPECRRCTSTGRRCDGYTSTTNTTSSEKQLIRVHPKPAKGLTFGIEYNALEKRTFDFFRSKTARCMSGYFQDPVWERLALQASYTEPVIRHAINAVGALHEERCLRADAAKTNAELNLKTDFPVHQYAKALAGLQQLLASGKASINIVLLCALLCVHYEALQERFIPALTHAENAMRLLDPAQAPSTEAIDPSLIRAFIRIDLQGTFFVDGRLPSLSFITSAAEYSELPKSFTDLEQARSFVITWSSRLFKFLREMAYKHRRESPGFFALECLAEAQSYEEVFIQLDRLLLSFMQKSTAKFTFRETHGLSMLRVLAMENRILAAASLYREASFHDRYLPEMEQMLCICRFVMDSDDPSNRLLSASLDDGMFRPLSFIVMQCRDSRIRHSALDLLKRLSSDGQTSWHIDAITKVTEKMVLLEEKDCEVEFPRCEDIPEWKRVHSFDFDAWILATQKRSKVLVTLRLRYALVSLSGMASSTDVEAGLREHLVFEVLC